MRIAFCGLGIMGSRMAANLAGAGHELRVWTHTEGKAAGWAAEHGAHAAPTPAEAADGAEVVITMVVDGDQVEAVLLGEQGAAAGAPGGALCLDMSTIAPAQARALGTALGQRGLRFVDAPVTGSSPKAQDGTLTIMCGGSDEDVARARPLFDVMGQLVVHAGPVGSGALVKVISNAVSATNAVTLAQALVVARATGADLDALVEVMGAGSAASTMLTLKAGPMREHDYTTLFKTAHMLKDVALCLDEAAAAQVPFLAAAATRELLTATVARGLGDADFAAVLEAVEGLAGVRL